jgi:hypothetical protein
MLQSYQRKLGEKTELFIEYCGKNQVEKQKQFAQFSSILLTYARYGV